MTNLEIANTIRSQIHPTVLMCSGASKFMAIDSGLQFNIRNTSKYRSATIVVKLMPNDTYNLYLYSRKKLVHCLVDVYCDELSYHLEGMWEKKEVLKQWEGR